MRLSFRVPLGLVLSLWLAMLGNASACLWLRGTTIEGEYSDKRPGHSNSVWLQKTIDSTPIQRMDVIQRSRLPSSTESAQRNDSAVEILLQGNAKGAAEQLEEIEKSHPGDYYTAANLGTAYELLGDDEKALQWIREGIKRDPDAHMTTEWLHARILEAKIALKSDPSWLEHHTITGVDFSHLREPGYRLETLQGKLDAPALHRSLWTQLSVRMLFVKPKDVVVAHLLYELALVEAQTKFLEEAMGYAKTATIYGLPPNKTDPLVRGWAKTIWWSGLRQSSLQVLLWIALAIALLWALDVARKALRNIFA
jgi:tetratricopeptide (TPR) repeat protein